MPYVGERLGRLIIKFLPAALAGEGRALLRNLIDKKILGNESKVIEETVRLVKMAHSSVPVSAATKGMNKKDKRARSQRRRPRVSKASQAARSVNGIGVNFTFINAVEAVDGIADDRGERTDPTRDYAVRASANPGRTATPTPNPTSPPAGEDGQDGDAPPSF
eukprot:84833-Pleurochrysis_carterae.AAC.1